MSSTQSIDTHHQDMIHDAQLDYYGRRLATCSSDRSVKIFEIGDDGQQQVVPSAVLNGHEGPVWQVAWAHPKFGNLLASVSYDRKLLIWKEAQQHQWIKLYEYAQHDLSVNSVAWAPHELGLMLACASSDGSISILSYHEQGGQWLASKIPAAHPVGVNCVSWAPALAPGFLVGGAGGAGAGGATSDAAAPADPSAYVQRLASGGCDNVIKVWRFHAADQSWRCEEELTAHQDWVRDVAWAPNIGLPTSVLASCSQDGSVVVWSESASSSSDSGNKSGAGDGGSLEGAAAGAPGSDAGPKSRFVPTPLPKFPDVVWRVSWSLTGAILAVAGGDGKVSLFKDNGEGVWELISALDKDSASAAGPAPGPGRTA